MGIVPRQNNDLAVSDHEGLIIPNVNSNAKFAFDHVVVNDQVGRRPERRPAMLARNTRRDAPRLEEVGMQEYAAGQMRHPQDVR